MSFLANKKILITIGVGIVSIVGLTALGVRSIAKQVENIFDFLDDGFIDFSDEADSDDYMDSDVVELSSRGQDEDGTKNYLSIFKR